MKKNYLLLILTLVLINTHAQQIDENASTTSISFTHEEGYTNNTRVNDLADFVATSSNTFGQTIGNSGAGSNYHRITVKRQYQRHQKDLAMTGEPGEIITLKMKFKFNGTMVANKEIFSLGLKSVFDSSNTQTYLNGVDSETGEVDPGVRNGEVISIFNNSENNLEIRYKTDFETALYSTTDWKYLTIKFFIGNTLANSVIKAKLDNGDSTSGWVDQSWQSEPLYEAIVEGNGAYMIFASNTSLGTDNSANHLYIDQYDFTIDNDNGTVFLGGDGGFVGASSWSTGTAPTNSDRLFIFGKSPNLNNASNNFEYSYMYLDSTSTVSVTSVNNLILNDLDVEGTLNILEGPNAVSINNDLSVSTYADLSISSGSSLIVSGSSSGNVKYNRQLTVDESQDDWFGITSPVNGQDIETFLDRHVPASGSGSNIGLTSSYAAFTNQWTYYTSSDEDMGNFVTGKGYYFRPSDQTQNVDVYFEGTIRSSAANRTLNTAGYSSDGGYNIVGNPFTSYMMTQNMLQDNTSVLKTETIWIWNTANGSYDTKITADSFYLAPGQTFWVRSNGPSGADDDILHLETTFQSHWNDDTFQRTDPRPEIHLTLSEGSLSRLAKIYYIDGTTTGFDNGFDGPMFTASDTSFAFYTHLVNDSDGTDYAIQSLPPDNYENMIIPVGINAISGTEISIDASITNFPEGMNVYLEDKEDDSFTLLDGSANFTTTLASDLNGIGRFYLHTTAGSLGADDLSMNNNISIYTSSRENLRIVGVQNGTATVQLYNILGKEVFRTTFEGTGMNDIQLPSLPQGMYIVNLGTVNGTINKKIIIQ